jgi:hypothetical protein
MVITTAVMAIVIGGGDSPAILASRWDTLGVFFFHHLQKPGDRSVDAEEEEKGGQDKAQRWHY